MHPYIATQLREVAKRRNAKFAHLARNRPLSSNYEDVGVMGEWAFAEFCGLMPNTRGGADGGKDFEVPVVFTVDVKTSRKGDYLLVEAGKVKADIYVLVHYMGEAAGDSGSRLVGWAFATQIKALEPRDTGRGVHNHALPSEQLRPMAELEKMMGRIKRG